LASIRILDRRLLVAGGHRAGGIEPGRVTAQERDRPRRCLVASSWISSSCTAMLWGLLDDVA